METFSPLILIDVNNLEVIFKTIPVFIVVGILLSGMLYFIGFTVDFIYMESVVTALTTSFGEVVTSCIGIVGSILPVALPLIGSVMVVTFGVKIFKKVTAKA